MDVIEISLYIYETPTLETGVYVSGWSSDLQIMPTIAQTVAIFRETDMEI